MRKLAQELGVEAMSLYNHVAGKDDLLGGMVDMVAGEIDLAEDERDRRKAMRRRAVSAHDVLARHPWAAALWMRRGSEDGATDAASQVVQSYVLGFALQGPRRARGATFESGLDLILDSLERATAGGRRGSGADRRPAAGPRAPRRR
jgi:AcrR family transcriptional regulator